VKRAKGGRSPRDISGMNSTGGRGNFSLGSSMEVEGTGRGKTQSYICHENGMGKLEFSERGGEEEKNLYKSFITCSYFKERRS